VVNDTIVWLRDEYEVIFEDGMGAMKVHWGKVYNYLGMLLDYYHWGEVRLSMPKHLDNVQKTFEECLTKTSKGL
jgi:hypothetical protein